jgi:hypothetical protein
MQMPELQVRELHVRQEREPDLRLRHKKQQPKSQEVMSRHRPGFDREAGAVSFPP